MSEKSQIFRAIRHRCEKSSDVSVACGCLFPEPFRPCFAQEIILFGLSWEWVLCIDGEAAAAINYSGEDTYFGLTGTLLGIGDWAFLECEVFTSGGTLKYRT